MADGGNASMNKKRNELKIVVYNVKNRKVEDIVWCALCNDVKPLFWKDGKLLCFEMRFYPKESKMLQVEGIPSVPPTIIPVVKASPTAEKILEETLKILSQS